MAEWTPATGFLIINQWALIFNHWWRGTVDWFHLSARNIDSHHAIYCRKSMAGVIEIIWDGREQDGARDKKRVNYTRPKLILPLTQFQLGEMEKVQLPDNRKKKTGKRKKGQRRKSRMKERAMWGMKKRKEKDKNKWKDHRDRADRCYKTVKTEKSV